MLRLARQSAFRCKRPPLRLLAFVPRRGLATAAPPELLESGPTPQQPAELVASTSDATLSIVEQAATPATLGMWPPDLVLRAVESVHIACDVPWWVAIGMCTLGIRVGLLPLAVYGSRLQAAMLRIRPELAPLQARLQAAAGDPVAQSSVSAEMAAVYARHDVAPMRMLVLPLVQMPIFMSSFFGLRRLSEAFPDAHTGGYGWFLDLGAVDTSYYLPAASGLSALALVRLSVPGATAGMTLAEAEQADLMRRVLSAVTCVSLPVAASMPASVLVFWITNNALSLVYTSALLFPPTRVAFGFPPQAGPYDYSASDTSSAAAVLPPRSSPDVVSMGRAQRSAADSLAAVAATMRAAGKAEEADSMQRRALAMFEEAEAAEGSAGEEPPGWVREARAAADDRPSETA